MRSLDEVLDALAYHPATPETAPLFDAARQTVSVCAASLWNIVPDGPDKTLAMRKLQEALFYSSFAIAMTSPADREHAAVARVLPPTLVRCSCGEVELGPDLSLEAPRLNGKVHTTVSCGTDMRGKVPTGTDPNTSPEVGAVQ